MADLDITIRRLVPKDADIYKEIRLESLVMHPESFGSTVENEKNRSVSWFEERLVNSTVLGAFQGTELVGVAGFFVQSGEKTSHKATLWGMYVRAIASGAGVGTMLVKAVIDCAKGNVELIQLAVVSDNLQARNLYKKCGFKEYGLEEKALKYAGSYYDEFRMVYFIRNGS